MLPRVGIRACCALQSGRSLQSALSTAAPARLRQSRAPFLRVTGSQSVARFSGGTPRLSASAFTSQPKGEDFQAHVELAIGISKAHAQRVYDQIDEKLQSVAPKTLQEATSDGSYDIDLGLSGDHHTGFFHPHMIRLDKLDHGQWKVPDYYMIEFIGFSITAEQKEEAITAIRQLEGVTDAQTHAWMRRVIVPWFA